ncbi:hypothetical protein [Streptosporangium sp. NPDC000509]|uniref:hypothetical protein n=1 Tax=Streptosporangium sp. NPDC000509 TaxID=3366186 RepID=UPI0036BE8528
MPGTGPALSRGQIIDATGGPGSAGWWEEIDRERANALEQVRAEAAQRLEAARTEAQRRIDTTEQELTEAIAEIERARQGASRDTSETGNELVMSPVRAGSCQEPNTPDPLTGLRGDTPRCLT